MLAAIAEMKKRAREHLMTALGPRRWMDGLDYSNAEVYAVKSSIAANTSVKSLATFRNLTLSIVLVHQMLYLVAHVAKHL